MGYFTSVAFADRAAASGAEPVVYGPAVGPVVMRPPRSLTALARETEALGAAADAVQAAASRA